MEEKFKGQSFCFHETVPEKIKGTVVFATSAVEGKNTNLYFHQPIPQNNYTENVKVKLIL